MIKKAVIGGALIGSLNFFVFYLLFPLLNYLEISDKSYYLDSLLVFLFIYNLFYVILGAIIGLLFFQGGGWKTLLKGAVEGLVLYTIPYFFWAIGIRNELLSYLEQGYYYSLPLLGVMIALLLNKGILRNLKNDERPLLKWLPAVYLFLLLLLGSLNFIPSFIREKYQNKYPNNRIRNFYSEWKIYKEPKDNLYSLEYPAIWITQQEKEDNCIGRLDLKNSNTTSRFTICFYENKYFGRAKEQADFWAQNKKVIQTDNIQLDGQEALRKQVKDGDYIVTYIFLEYDKYKTGNPALIVITYLELIKDLPYKDQIVFDRILRSFKLL